MEQTPLYFQPNKKKTANIGFFRNCRCPHYDQCLTRAAHEDLFLDCKECRLKDVQVEVFALDPNR